MVRKFAAIALSSNGYKTLEASTVAEGKNIFNEHSADIDCIFSDLLLPDDTGIELFKRIYEKNHSIKFLLSSGYTDEESNREAIVDMHFPFLAKPYTLNELLQAIYDILNQQTPG